MFKELTGRKVKKLWEKYCDEVESGGRASLGSRAWKEEEAGERQGNGSAEDDSGWEVLMMKDSCVVSTCLRAGWT